MSKPYIFIRKTESHTVELPDDLSARKAAAEARGVIRVEDAKGRVVWRYVRQITTPHAQRSHEVASPQSTGAP
jgi:hypothetical protein